MAHFTAQEKTVTSILTKKTRVVYYVLRDGVEVSTEPTMEDAIETAKSCNDAEAATKAWEEFCK